MKNQQQNFTFSFPGVRGIQAKREYYTFMCPLEYLPHLFPSTDEEIEPEMSTQRLINKSRIPAITKYILDNENSYAFSSITVSVSGAVKFTPISKEPPIDTQVGTLTIPLSAKFHVNDGQHRLTALKAAIKKSPHLKYEMISVVMYVDQGLKRSQQLFADLNRYTVRPTKSLNILFDHRDPLARLAYELTEEVEVFQELTEMAKPTLSNRSRKLFTLSSIYQSTSKLLNKKEGDEISAGEKKFAVDFWNGVAENMPDWQDARESRVKSSELRRDYIHAHGVALQALSNVGVYAINNGENDWKKLFKPLNSIDWSRTNKNLWEGRAMVAGVINRSQNNIILTGNQIKHHLDLQLDPHERKIEHEFLKGKE